MKWICISGSWRRTSRTIEEKVRGVVRDIIRDGNGIITGGALNVDYFATDEALKQNPAADRLKVFLPTTLDTYARHYRNRAREGIITTQQAEDLIAQLIAVRRTNPAALIENPDNDTIDATTYAERNSRELASADELVAFHVNGSAGVQDTIDKARYDSKPTTVYEYKF